MSSFSSTATVAFLASGLPTTRDTSFHTLVDGSAVFAPSSAPMPNLLAFCTITTPEPQLCSPTPKEPFLESWQRNFPGDLSSSVASPAPASSRHDHFPAPTSPSLRSSASSTSLDSLASTEPSTLFYMSALDSEDSFSSSFTTSSSAASTSSRCSLIDFDFDDSIFLNAVQASIAKFSPPSTVPLFFPAPPSHRKLASFSSSSGLPRTAPWEYRTGDSIPSLKARPAWRF